MPRVMLHISNLSAQRNGAYLRSVPYRVHTIDTGLIKKMYQAVVGNNFDPVLGRHRQEEIYEFKAALVCFTESSRTARATKRNPV